MEIKETEMKPKNVFSAERAINHYMRTFYNISETEFKLLFMSERLKMNGATSKQRVTLVSRANKIWEEWSKFKANKVREKWTEYSLEQFREKWTEYSPEQVKKQWLEYSEEQVKKQWLEYRAEEQWEKWNSLRRTLMAFWTTQDDINRQVIAEMVKLDR